MRICKIGDPIRLISERIYPIDFRPQFFETRNRISSEDAKTIAEKYQKGCSLRDIAKHLGSSKNRIRSELKRLGLEVRASSTQATHRRSLKPGKQGALPYYGFCGSVKKIVSPAVIHKQILWDSEEKTSYDITNGYYKSRS